MMPIILSKLFHSVVTFTTSEVTEWVETFNKQSLRSVHGFEGFKNVARKLRIFCITVGCDLTGNGIVAFFLISKKKLIETLPELVIKLGTKFVGS